MYNKKKVQILKFSFSVKFISETIRDNLSKYYQKLSAQYQFREKNWMKNKNSIYLPNIRNFRKLAPFRPLFEICCKFS
jgi:hypothetical protein